MKKEYIYALCLKGGDPFYVGRTNDLKRRMGEHKNAAANGHTETKYQIIRSILAGGDEWDYFVLAEIKDVTDPYEDFWVYTLLMDGYMLANMKAGDAVQQAKNDAMQSMRARKASYSSAKEFLGALEQERAEQAARAATARFNAKKTKVADDICPALTLFDYEKLTERFVSPAFRDLKRVAGHKHVYKPKGR